MAITPLPSAPNKAIDTTQQFADKADAWVAALSTFTTEANALQTDVNNKQTTATNAANTATDQAGLAVASAASAIAAPGTSATSTTSLAIGTGSKTLTVEAGKDLVVGMAVMIASTVAPATNWMHGIITSYTSGTGVLVVTVDTIGGSGTIAAWTVSISAPVVASLGAGQTWQDVTSTRELGTNYQNTTAKPIVVNVMVTTATTGSHMLEVFVSSSTPPTENVITEVYRWDSSWLTMVKTVSVVVPSGHYYKAAQTGSLAKYKWNELR